MRVFFWGFILFFCLEYTPVSSFCLTFYVCFYELGETATSPSLEGVVLCRSVPCVDRVALSGWLEQAWPRMFQGATHWGCLGGTAGAGEGQGYYSP